MLLLFALLTVCIFRESICLSDEMQELVDMLHNTCSTETGVAEDMIENARKGNFVEDDKLKCYMKCLLEQMACIDDDGIIDVDATVAVLPEEYQDKADPIIRNCGTQVGANPCDNAFLTNKCWYTAAPNDYFLV